MPQGASNPSTMGSIPPTYTFSSRSGSWCYWSLVLAQYNSSKCRGNHSLSTYISLPTTTITEQHHRKTHRIQHALPLHDCEYTIDNRSPIPEQAKVNTLERWANTSDRDAVKNLAPISQMTQRLNYQGLLIFNTRTEIRTPARAPSQLRLDFTSPYCARTNNFISWQHQTCCKQQSRM